MRGGVIDFLVMRLWFVDLSGSLSLWGESSLCGFGLEFVVFKHLEKYIYITISYMD